MGPHADALISYTSPGSGQMSWGHLSGICYTYSQCERESSFISLRVVTPYRQTHWWFAKVQRCSSKHSTSRRTRTLYRTTALNLVHWTELNWTSWPSYTKRWMITRTVHRQVTSTYFVLIGCKHSELNCIFREQKFARCEHSHWNTCIRNNFARSVQLMWVSISEHF